MATFTRTGTRKRPVVNNPAIAALLVEAGWQELTPSNADGSPRGNASRDEWVAYAATLGIEIPEDAKRDDIKAQIEAAKAAES